MSEYQKKRLLIVPNGRCQSPPTNKRSLLLKGPLTFSLVVFFCMCDLAKGSPSANPVYNGIWSSFHPNKTSNVAGFEESTESDYYNKNEPLVYTRRSRKTEFEFPDGDHILTSGEVVDGPNDPRLWRSGPCTCINTTAPASSRGFALNEVVCECSGSNFSQLGGVAVLPQNVHRLAIERAKDFTTLGNDDLRPFASTLTELVLSEVPQFKELKPGTFKGMGKLETIYIHEAASLKEIPDDVFKLFLPKLKIIRITRTGLETVPNLGQLFTDTALHMVELENGKMSKIPPGSFTNLKTAHLSLGYNSLTEIGPRAFNGSTVAQLGLNGNRQLRTIHPEAFLGIKFLSVLDLSETSINYLPTQGLKDLEVLRLENVWTLSVIPSIYHFQSLTTAVLTWPYHCCAFEDPEKHDPYAYQAYQDYVRSAVEQQCAKALGTLSSTSSSPLDMDMDDGGEGDGLLEPSFGSGRFPLRSRRTRRSEQKKPGKNSANDNGDGQGALFKGQQDWDRSFGNVLDPQEKRTDGGFDAGLDFGTFGDAEDVKDEFGGVFHNSVNPSQPSSIVTLCGNLSLNSKKHPKVKCSPVPDAFNPCEDIMGSLWLRGAVWVVVALALVGNTAVLVVLILAPGRMTVQRLLMANLSWADLCMGIYLLMVATQDLVSLGSYFNYAIDWQLGWGCQIAGFLTVFASELSVFTLVVITGERWYALTRAIHLTKRLTLGGSAQLMGLGWALSVILAGLPLLGVSSYSKTSICLPMEANSAGSVVYLAFLLLFNGLAFLLVATAYWQMYTAVAGHGGSNSAAPGASSADTAIAKKMALLVFTDFACWAPVAFFGLTAVGGYPLIGVTDSKILLVFFYPLNSTLNPYLYAIMTKQYRRDLLLLLSRHGICTKRAAKYKAGGVSTNNTLQTMQTVLRLGSLTETKVTNSHHHHHHHSPNGPNGGGTSSTTLKLPHKQSHIFDHPILPPEQIKEESLKGHEDEDEHEEDAINGVNGRLLAETSFIHIPSPKNGKHVKLINQDSHDEIAEVSEFTPFCRAGS